MNNNAKRARQIFIEVSGLSSADRERALDRACAGDSGLRDQVETMLRVMTNSDELDGQATSDTLADPTGDNDEPTILMHQSVQRAQEVRGQLIDRYKLLEQIGEGGFGSVWAAEQRQPVKRRVALKIIKLGMDTKQVIARFEAERQALAMMDHPNIAKVLDAGTTDTGRPFFVMELVKGVPIIEYCDHEKLDTRARLDLFTLVCNAIQHAHQKGIIHRDIKPSNVLVTLHDGVPVPKVIDFGIAKATNAELTEKTIYTQHHQMIGTPAYMSPEQAEMSGLDIDTRSDIYSLGVLLYELLTGTTPFTQEELASAGFEGMMRLIRDGEHHKPSTRLSSMGHKVTSTAQQRRADPQKLSLLLRGDLDWIVMKCLEKDRARRYDSATGLAEDIRRHLNNEPVMAGPPNAGYKLRKFIKRNKRQVVAGSVVAGVLLLGVLGTSTGLVWALEEKTRADNAAEIADAARDESDRERLAADRARRDTEAQLARSEEFKGFMVELLSGIEPDREHPERSLAIRELIDNAYEKLRAGDVRDGDARAEVIELLAETANRHSWYDLQIDLRYAKLDEAKRRFGPDDRRTLSAALSLGVALMSEDRAIEVRRIVHEYAGAAEKLDAERGGFASQLSLLSISAAAERVLGNYERALAEHARGLELAEQLGDKWYIYYHQSFIARNLLMTGRLEESLESLDAAKRTSDAGGGTLLNSFWFSLRADLMMDLKRYEEALALYLEAEERVARNRPDDFSQHAWGAGAARALRAIGRADEALNKAVEAREGMLLKRAPAYMVRDSTRHIIRMLSELGLKAERDRELAAFLMPPSDSLVVYRDGLVMPYSPSGIMGEVDKVNFDLFSTDTPYEGEHCFKWQVLPGETWVAMALLEPSNDWGDLPGGYNMTGAHSLSFVARGSVGGERIRVGIGLVDSGEYPDTLRERIQIELSTAWQRFTMPLEGLDLSTVRSGFVIESALSEEPKTVYFDDIRIH